MKALKKILTQLLSVRIGDYYGFSLAAKGASISPENILFLEEVGIFQEKRLRFDVGASMIFGFGEKGYKFINLSFKRQTKNETIPDPVQLSIISQII